LGLGLGPENTGWGQTPGDPHFVNIWNSLPNYVVPSLCLLTLLMYLRTD